MAELLRLARAHRGALVRCVRAPAPLSAAGRVYSTYEYQCSGAGVGPSAKIVFPGGGGGGGTPHEVRTDLPKKIGGRDEHPQPVEYLLAALIGCEVSTATFVARHMQPRMKLEHIEFSYRGCRNAAIPVHLPLDADLPASPALQRVYGTATVRCAAPETQARVEELMRHTQARCPVHSTLAGVQFDTKWVLDCK